MGREREESSSVNWMESEMAMEMRMEARFLQVDRSTLGPSEVDQYIFFFFSSHLFSPFLTFCSWGGLHFPSGRQAGGGVY